MHLRVRDYIRPIVPVSLLSSYRDLRQLVQRWRYRGNKYFCNVCFSNLCGWIYAGPKSHKNLLCPVCLSYGRHRFLAMILEDEISYNVATRGGSFLHFSPELGLARWIKSRYPNFIYKTSDFNSTTCDFRLDLHKLNLSNNSIDYIVLSHVLEHIDNDGKALTELYRVLSPGGKLFIQVPLSDISDTIDEKLNSEKERFERYGKSDHVRLYGAGIYARLSSHGFDVGVYQAHGSKYETYFLNRALDIPGNSTMIYSSESTIFVCCKPVS